jgi:lipopolysaccharide biosynthesis regulator YciM
LGKHPKRPGDNKAIPGLRAAVEDSPQTARFGLYLGVSYLLTGQTESAIEWLRRVIAIGQRTYAEPAHFYLAKAYLQKKDVEAAIVQLQATTQFHDSNQAEAADMLHRLGK